MSSNRDILGAVLTGGRSSRMGQDKSDVLVGEQTMLQRVAAAIGDVTEHVVVLGPERDGWENWPDSVHVQGPLAGIATALSRTTSEHVLLVAVDHAFVSSETLRHMIELVDLLPVVPVDDHGVRQVTCAIYPKSIAEAAVEEATQGGSIQSLLDRVSFDAVSPETWRGWGEDGRSWFSTDEPAAVSEGLGLFESG